FEGSRYDFILEKEDTAKFKTLSARHNGTLYMNILAALNTLFYKYTGHTDIIIGSAIAGRPHADLQDIVGMFINTLAMRNFPEGEKSYESFLQEVIHQSVKAFGNQDVQFEELVDKLELERDPSRNPLFDIMMEVTNFRIGGEGQGQEINPRQTQPGVSPAMSESLPFLNYKPSTSKFDMTFDIHEQGEDVYIILEYYTSLFKQQTIANLVRHLKKVIREVTAHPDIRLKDI
ncbi:MAG: hypothetical protein GY940_40305, partial [bacterium]|nr:hypothetical protein [bacterium]